MPLSQHGRCCGAQWVRPGMLASNLHYAGQSLTLIWSSDAEDEDF